MPEFARVLVSMVVLVGIVSGAGTATPQGTEDKLHFRASWKEGGHALEVVVDAGPFVAADHQVRFVNGEKWVDGSPAIGIDGTGEIENEIKAFTITWDGKKIPVPKAAYAPLFNFSLRKASLFPGDIGELLATRSSNDAAVLFIFAGGTEAVREWVWLIVSRDGKWFRFEGSDGASPL